MTTVLLLPRLPLMHAAQLLESFEITPPSPVSTCKDLDAFADRITYAPSGGHPSPEKAIELASGLREIACGCGCPDTGNQESRSRFDVEATKYLASHPLLHSGESLRDDVWACLAMVFLPDVVGWRFGGYPRERYLGGVRNALQRLWVRGVTLDRGEAAEDRWELVEKLSEDGMVQIFERASISGHDLLARVIAEAWVQTEDQVPPGTMEDIMRQAMIVIRLRNEVYDFPGMKPSILMEEVCAVFSLATGLDGLEYRIGEKSGVGENSRKETNT